MRTRASFLVVIGLGLTACGDDEGPAGVDTTEGETTGTGSSSTSGNTVSASGMAEGESLDSTGGSTSTGMADGSFLDGMTTDEPPPPKPQPNGGQCMDGGECESGFCYQIPMLGGVCSECLTDTDCETGTCSLDPMALYAVCTKPDCEHRPAGAPAVKVPSGHPLPPGGVR